MQTFVETQSIKTSAVLKLVGSVPVGCGLVRAYGAVVCGISAPASYLNVPDGVRSLLFTCQCIYYKERRCSLLPAAHSMSCYIQQYTKNISKTHTRTHTHMVTYILRSMYVSMQPLFSRSVRSVGTSLCATQLSFRFGLLPLGDLL